MASIDLNCDAGESFGAWTLGADEALFEHVTSANIACGAHAGDPAVMRRTVRSALARGLAIGAHPGLPDLAGFGRRNLAITPDEAYELVVYQVGALLGFALAAGARLAHVKPHGALYNMAAADAALADAIAAAVRDVDRSLVLYGLAGSELVRAAERAGLVAAPEAFVDRNYHENGRLVSRARPDALVRGAGEAAARAVRLVRDRVVTSVEGTPVSMEARTLCIHGDGAEAVALARSVRNALQEAGITVSAEAVRGERD